MTHAKETLGRLNFKDKDMMQLGMMGHRMKAVKDTFFKIADYAAMTN